MVFWHLLHAVATCTVTARAGVIVVGMLEPRHVVTVPQLVAALAVGAQIEIAGLAFERRITLGNGAITLGNGAVALACELGDLVLKAVAGTSVNEQRPAGFSVRRRRATTDEVLDL